MRGVGDELSQAILRGLKITNRLLDSFEHHVQCDCDVANLGSSVGVRNAMHQVTIGDCLGGADDVSQWSEPDPDQPKPEQDGA